MTREMILRDRLDMACHNLLCYSETYLMDTPKAGYEKKHAEAAAEVEMLEDWLKEFDTNHNPAHCTSRSAIVMLKVIDESILKMAGGGIAAKDKLTYLEAYSNDIRGIIEHLKKICEAE